MNIKRKVFLDANVLIQAGRPPGGPLISRLAALSAAGRIQILTTDLTITEVAKKHTDTDYLIIKELGNKHLRTLAKNYLDGVSIPDVSRKQIKELISIKYYCSVKAMLNGIKAKILNIDEVNPSSVFNDYSKGIGFFSGEGKKDQFPDAFIFQRIKKEASKNSPVIIVSNDGDFVSPSENEEYITLIKSIPSLFYELGFKTDDVDTSKFFKDNEERLVELFDFEINEYGLIGDVEDSEIEEIVVSYVEIIDKTCFGPINNDDFMLIVGCANVTVKVSYTHPDWDNAMYDSEDKVLIPFDEVHGEVDLEIKIDFSMSIYINEDGDLAEIETLDFNNEKFQCITLNPYDPWEYK